MEFIQYNRSEHDGLLNRYFTDPRTPVNNRSHIGLKTHLYNGVSGIMGMMVDQGEILALSSAIVVEEHGVISCKYPHRLHIRSDFQAGGNKFIDQHWDTTVHQWLIDSHIRNVYCTFNASNESVFRWAAIRHHRRVDNPYLTNPGQSLMNQSWMVHHKMILEMYVPQYLIYSNPQAEWFYPWRDEFDMPVNTISYLNQRLSKSTSGWLM